MNRNDKRFMVEKIRTKYVEKKDSSLDELRKLDKKVEDKCVEAMFAKEGESVEDAKKRLSGKSNNDEEAK
jgi:hypothetical protein